MNEQQQPERDNHCLDSGLLIGLRDGELSAEERALATSHLATCEYCTHEEDQLHASGQHVYDTLALLSPHTQELPVVEAAFARLQLRLDSAQTSAQAVSHLPVQSGRQLKRAGRLTKQRYRWLAAAAAVILIAILLLPNAGALATQFLSLFRPQQFQAVVIDPRGVESQLWTYLQNFSDVQANYNNETLPDTLSKAQAEQIAQMKLQLPSTLPAGVGQTPKFGFINGQQGTFTFDATKARAYLSQSGQDSVKIPAQLVGAVYNVTISTGVNIDYYQQCTINSNNRPQCSGGETFSISELPVPTIRASGKDSLNDLRDFMLSLPKLSNSLRSLLEHTDEHSGIVPIPVTAQMGSQNVTVQNTHGLLMSESNLGSALIWETNNTVYLIVSTISDSTQLLQTANSMR